MSFAHAKPEPRASRIDHTGRILEAAIACFSRSGFHGASMQEICAEAQMSPGALYRYFPSKESIIEAIAMAQRERDAAMLASFEGEGPVMPRLMDSGITHMREMMAGPLAGLCSEVLAEGHRNPKIRAAFEENHQIALKAVHAALERAKLQGEIDPALDLNGTLPIIMSMFDGILIRSGFDPAMTMERIEPALRDILERIVSPKLPRAPAAVPSGV